MGAYMRRWKEFAANAIRANRKAVATVVATAALAAGGIYPVEVALNAAGGNQFLAVSKPPAEVGTPISLGATASAANAFMAAASAVQGGVTAAGSSVQQALSPNAPAQELHVVTDQVREAFFSSKIPFGAIILREAKKNELAPELVAAVIKQESRFNPSARSGAGAVGLMQLVPRTGRKMGARNLLNPEQNIAAGARYLRYLSDEFGGNEKKVIAAYNAGEGNVRKFGGLPPFKETRTYVKNVVKFRNEMANTVATEAAATQPGL